MTLFEKSVYLACKEFIKCYDRASQGQENVTPINSVRTQKAPNNSNNDIPICDIHKQYMKLKHGQYGDFYSCPIKDEQGNYCRSKQRL